MERNLLDKKICFIGAGSMAEAIIKGIIQKEMARSELIFVNNRNHVARLEALQQQYGVQYSIDTFTKQHFIQSADIVVLAMKPQDAEIAIKEIRHLLHPQQMLISIIAGLSIETIEKLLHHPLPIIRTMPNTSSTIGLGATGISFSSMVSEEQMGLATDLFHAVGEVCDVEEQQLDIVTGLSGTGPAYIYYMLEAMTEAGVAGGLTKDVAEKLAIQTALGAAQMLKTTKEDPAVLRKKVTSPGGTTEAAIKKLEEFRFTEGVKAAILRATERSRELGKAISTDKKD